MQLLLTAPNLTTPTVQDIRTYFQDKASRLQKFLPNFPGEYKLKVSIRREKSTFVVNIEIDMPKPVFVQSEDGNLYEALDQAYHTLKRSVNKYNGKRKERRQKRRK